MVIITIRDENDAILLLYHGRRLAREAGFCEVEQAALSTAILEIARNVVKYAGQGMAELSIIHEPYPNGIRIVVCDKGPGIPDIARAMQDGYSTGKGLGLGLPGAKRLVNHFEIESQPGKGTTVSMIKWASHV